MTRSDRFVPSGLRAHDALIQLGLERIELELGRRRASYSFGEIDAVRLSLLLCLPLGFLSLIDLVGQRFISPAIPAASKLPRVDRRRVAMPWTVFTTEFTML